ncbi:MAG: hypothetical protein ICV75_09295, partial [Nitrospiraceae bacterium]|nr:hypothetical protein [Nitrospiraceae bacterium]
MKYCSTMKPAATLLSILVFVVLEASGSPAHAVPMMNDPQGFHDIAWGAALTGRPDLEPIRVGAHIKEYRLSSGTPTFAGAEMGSIGYLTVDDQFARVT